MKISFSPIESTSRTTQPASPSTSADPFQFLNETNSRGEKKFTLAGPVDANNVFIEGLRQLYCLKDYEYGAELDHDVLRRNNLAWEGSKKLYSQISNFGEPLNPSLYPPEHSKQYEHSPNVSVRLCPTVDGNLIGIKKNDTYKKSPLPMLAPLLVNLNSGNWGSRQDIRGHLINGYYGQPKGISEFFDKPLTLEEVVSDDPRKDLVGRCPPLSKLINERTPIIDLAAFCPIAPNGEYVTQCVPKISSDEHLFVMINQDKLVYRRPQKGNNLELTNSQEVDSSGREKKYLWEVTPKSKQDRMFQSIMPSSSGQIIILAIPRELTQVEKLFESAVPIGGDVPEEQPQGQNIGQTFLSQGTESGSTGVYKGQIVLQEEQPATIYRINIFGVEAPYSISTDTLVKFARAQYG